MTNEEWKKTKKELSSKHHEEEMRLGLLKCRVYPPLTEKEKKELKEWEKHCKNTENFQNWIDNLK